MSEVKTENSARININCTSQGMEGGGGAQQNLNWHTHPEVCTCGMCKRSHIYRHSQAIRNISTYISDAHAHTCNHIKVIQAYFQLNKKELVYIDIRGGWTSSSNRHLSGKR